MTFETWLKNSDHGWLESVATMIVALGAYVAYACIIKGQADAFGEIKISSAEEERVLLAINSWHVFWILTFGYSVKVFWDHAKTLIRKRRRILDK